MKDALFPSLVRWPGALTKREMEDLVEYRTPTPARTLSISEESGVPQHSELEPSAQVAQSDRRAAESYRNCSVEPDFLIISAVRTFRVLFLSVLGSLSSPSLNPALSRARLVISFFGIVKFLDSMRLHRPLIWPTRT